MSGTDTSESGSWESIVLETPDGVRREFIVKPSTETKPAQGELKPKPKHKEDKDTSVLVVTRAQAQQEQEKKVDSLNPESSTSQKKRKKTSKLQKKSKESNPNDSDSDQSMKKLLESRKMKQNQRICKKLDEKMKKNDEEEIAHGYEKQRGRIDHC